MPVIATIHDDPALHVNGHGTAAATPRPRTCPACATDPDLSAMLERVERIRSLIGQMSQQCRCSGGAVDA